MRAVLEEHALERSLSFLDEIERSDPELRGYLAAEFGKLLAMRDFAVWLVAFNVMSVPSGKISARLQSSVLVPLELRLAALPATESWAPGTWVTTVLTAISGRT